MQEQRPLIQSVGISPDRSLPFDGEMFFPGFDLDAPAEDRAGTSAGVPPPATFRLVLTVAVIEIRVDGTTDPNRAEDRGDSSTAPDLLAALQRLLGR